MSERTPKCSAMSALGWCVVGATAQERAGRSECHPCHLGAFRCHRPIVAAGGRARELRPRALHDGPPGRSVGIARVKQPGAVAGEDLEHRLEDVAHHLLDVARFLHGAVDPVHRLEEPYVRAALRLGELAVGDMAADAAVADEPPEFVEDRHPGNRHVALAPVGRRTRELEILEREMRVERGPVPAPSLFVGLEVRNFPSRLADLRAGRRRVSEPVPELLAGKTVLRIGLPVHVEGELHESAEALSARAKRVLGAPSSRGELAEQQAQTDEDREGQHMIRRDGERIHGRDEPVAHSRYADQRSPQAGPASAVPGGQHDGGKRKLVDRGAFPERKYATQEQREAGQRQGKAIALEHLSALSG